MFYRFVADLRSWLVNPMTLYAWIVSSIIATIAGPFGTYSSMELGVRGLFWSGLIGTSVILSFSLAVLARLILVGWSVLSRDMAVILVFSLLFTPVVMVAIRMTGDGGAEPALEPMAIWVSVLAIAAAVSLILHQVEVHMPSFSVQAPRHAANSDHHGGQEPRLIRRLDGVSLRDVVRLTVEDHYVVVVEHDGTEHRLLMRFGDAVQEMEGAAGYCVHRSHWVMRRAIREVVKRQGREMVALTNGTYVPVSRTYRQNLVDAGLLEPLEGRAAG